MSKNFIFKGVFYALLLSAVPMFSASPLKFDFGNGKTQCGYTKVDSETVYSDSLGYGFDYGTTAISDKRHKKGNLRSDFVKSDKPFYFSVKLPEGNYKVTFTLGDQRGKSNTTIKAESRRLMLEDIITQKGEVVTKSVIINVRTPRISDTERIRIKKREYSYLNWDDKLTIEFTGSNPVVSALEIEEVGHVPTVFLAGNSTVTDQDTEPYASWGQMITRFFKPEIVVANYAESGEALASFKGAKRLDKILSLMQPGDYLFIEFGHNDMKRKGEGIGPWTSFSDLLREFVTRAHEKGGIPVLIAPMNRRTFDENGKVTNTHGDYPDAVRKVAQDMHVPLIDLHYVTRELYEAWGPEKSKGAFVQYPAGTFPGQTKALADNTHFNNYGAYQIAKCIIQGIKDNKLDLEKYLVDGIPTYHYGKPDSMEEWHLPYSNRSDVEKPDGN